MLFTPHPVRFFLACVVFSLALLVYVYYAFYYGELRDPLVAFLDVGQGDAVFIETERAFQILVDTGRGNKVLSALGKVMSPSDKSIDMVVITHPDSDHIGGLASVLRQFDVSYLLVSDMDDITQDANLKRAVDEESDMHILIADAPSQMQFPPSTLIRVLWSADGDVIPEKNARSIVLHIEGEERSFLLTGDIPSSVERELVRLYESSLDVDVLKLAHHGSKTSSSAAFLNATNPRAVVVSAGIDNSYGHPHMEVLDRVGEVLPEAQIRQTAQEGTIRFNL